MTHTADCNGWLLLRDDPVFGQYHEMCKDVSHKMIPTLFDSKES